jgi:4-hydroxybenzoate polyprenyltransferase
MSEFLKRIVNAFVFGNFFIAFCAAGMTLTTLLMNGLALKFTPFTLFISLATYQLYNFHRISFKLDYSSWERIKISVKKIVLKPYEKFFLSLTLLCMAATLFFMKASIYLYLIPLVILSLSYSIPIIRKRNKNIRLLEVFLIKTPVLAFVWGVSTTVIPLVEQNINVWTSFVMLQVISRTLFIFALCIPFEMRDKEQDKGNNVRTLPVIFGITATKIIGCVIVLIEIFTHHFMTIPEAAILALDITSIVSLYWILFHQQNKSPLHYKFFVDGTMLLRFILLVIAIQIS